MNKNSYFLKSLLVIGVLSLTSFGTAYADKTATSEPMSKPSATLEVQAEPIEAVKPFIPVQELITQSGMKIWFVEDRSVPVLSLKFFFSNIGAAYDPDDKQGLARMVSNTLDEGAGELNGKDFQKMLSDHSIALSFSNSRDDFSGSLKTLTRYQDKAFGLLKLSLNSPRFDDGAIERMRNANIARIKSSLSKPGWITARIFNDTLYGDHPYAKNSGGTLSSLKAITKADLKAYVTENFTRDRLQIAVTGDIDAARLTAAVENIFGPLQQRRIRPLAQVAPFKWPAIGKSSLFTIDNMPQSKVMIALPAIGIDDDRYYAMSLLSTILGGSGFGSRLMEEIRENHGLTYGIYSGLSQGEAVNMLQINASSQNETMAELLTRTVDELTKLKTIAVSEEELQSHRDYLIGSMPLSLTSTDKISSIMQSLQMQDLPAAYYDSHAAKLKAVTPEDIQKLAAEFLDQNRAVSVVAGGLSSEGLPHSATQLQDFTPITVLPNVE
jgi:zinc protease